MNFKIFCETNNGPTYLENEINDYFSDEGRKGAKLISMISNCEIVDGITYMNVIICFDYQEEK